MFMEPEFTNEPFVTVTDAHGESKSFPAEFYNPEEFPGDVERHEDAFFYRLSASGYLDATDWCGPFDTYHAAKEDCAMTYFADCGCDDCKRGWCDDCEDCEMYLELMGPEE